MFKKTIQDGNENIQETPKTILLVEDEGMISLNQSVKLEKIGYKVIRAYSGEDAVRSALENNIDLVLMDINLGKGMDGTEASKKILAQKEIPIIFLTALSQKEDLEKVKDINRYGYVIKNLGEHLLENAIHTAFKLFDALTAARKNQEAYQAANSDLIAANEELTATNEELEATNEELKASNEILIEREEELRLKEMEYQLLIANLPFGFQLCKVIKNEKGEPIDCCFLDSNKLMKDYTGLAIEEVRDKTFSEVFPKGDISQTIKYCRVGLTGIPHTEEYFSKTFKRYLRATVYSPQKDKFAVILEDITERKKIEQAINDADAFKQAILDTSTVAIFAYDEIGKCETVNPAAAKITGGTEKILRDQNFRELDSWKKSGLLAAAEEALSSGKKVQKEIHHITTFGKDVWFDSQFMPFTIKGEQHLLLMNTDISARKKAEDAIKNLLTEKDLVLKEVHHRIKNNMNTISSLLNMTLMNLNDPDAINALQDSLNRIQTMSILYDKLYRVGGDNNISIKEYLDTLIDEIHSIFHNKNRVKINKSISDFIINNKKMFPLGILINEIITNAMRHAFKDRSDGLISIIAEKIQQKVTITIRDNGQGMPQSINFEKSSGYGMQLIRLLANQLGGTIRIERDNGTAFILEFEIEEQE